MRILAILMVLSSINAFADCKLQKVCNRDECFLFPVCTDDDRNTLSFEWLERPPTKAIECITKERIDGTLYSVCK